MINEITENVVHSLMHRSLKIATAESCTGGMLSQYITSVSGSSYVFEFGIVSYSNRVKANFLGVSQESLDEFGAVSEQVCIQMAEGILKLSKADIGAAITGIAGPTGGTREKPVGTVYIAVATESETKCKKLSLSGTRRDIREKTIKSILYFIKEVIDTL